VASSRSHWAPAIEWSNKGDGEVLMSIHAAALVRAAKEAVAGTATGRFTHPQEVADVVLLLASDRAGNVTGTDVVIDGGLVPTL
jgi:NAD(P)-dependent dehydrogenase (short-subunit alcohol dehydrogenase family)